MPKKKSVKKAVARFRDAMEGTLRFVGSASVGLGDGDVTRVYDAGIIFLYRDFERMILEVLVAAINNDTGTISETVGIAFPKHLTDEVCYYLVTGPSYFGFKGREGLIRRIKQYVPGDHYLVTTVKARRFKETLERLCALRNFAAHGSWQSKRAALRATGQKRMSAAGAWLKHGRRFTALVERLGELADMLEEQAPY